MDKKIKYSHPVPPFVRYCSAIIPTMFDDSLSYYEALCALWKWLQDNLVNVVNQNAAVTDYYIKIVDELKSYVENYFDNLDVQEEINNKLDAMTEAGTLQEIVGEYLNATATWGFDTVADMKASTNLIDGSFARTLGYYSKNDGGGALYKIRSVTNDDTVDESFIVEIGDPADNLVAELIIDNNEVSIKQLGAKSLAVDGTKFDIAPTITKYVNYRTANTGALRLYIPSGVYHSSPLTVICPNGLDIKGDFQFNLHTEAGTIISSLNDNQDYIWTFGDNSGATGSTNLHLTGLMFTTADYNFDSNSNKFKEGTIKSVNNYCVKIVRTSFSKIEDITFQHINGVGLVYRECWEIYNVRLNFRDIFIPSKAAFVFENRITYGTNTMYFDWLQFEQIVGHLVYSENNSNLQQIHIDYFTFEDYKVVRDGVEYTNLPSESYSDDTAIHYALFYIAGGDFKAINIDSLVVNNMGDWFSTFDNDDHMFDTIISIDREWTYCDITINSIAVAGQHKDNFILRGNNIIGFFDNSKITINNFTNTSTVYEWLFDVKRFPRIECNCNFKGTITSDSNLKCGNNGACPGDSVPAYTLVPKRVPSSRKGAIAGDKEVLNGANLAVECYTNSNSFQVITTKKTGGFIRAKIANGETFVLYIGNMPQAPGFYKKFTLTGTGEYVYYPLDFSDSATWYLGCPCYVTRDNASTADSLFIDVISI